jgi:hypothetical protein
LLARKIFEGNNGKDFDIKDVFNVAKSGCLVNDDGKYNVNIS